MLELPFELFVLVFELQIQSRFYLDEFRLLIVFLPEFILCYFELVLNLVQLHVLVVKLISELLDMVTDTEEVLVVVNGVI